MLPRTGEPSSIEEAYEKAVRALDEERIGSEEYDKILSNVARLHRMKVEERPDFVSRDTLALIGANLLGILLIIRHEHVNVITSRAMNWVVKPR